MRALFALLALAVFSQTPPDTVVPAEDLAPTKAGSYNWLERHEGVVRRVKQGKVDLILVGDSITHGWGGEPAEGGNNGNGAKLWDTFFGGRNAVNMGFGWDKTQHVLWRFDHGEIDGISPKAAVVMIGTNNVGSNTTPDIVAGITAIVDKIHVKLPKTKVLLLGIFPRDREPTSKNRQQLAEINKSIADLGKRPWITYMDLTDKFLEPDGTIAQTTMRDYLHPTAKGYETWGRAMEPTLAKLMGDKAR